MAALTNAFKILNCVSLSAAGGISFTKIVQETGLPKASVHRLVKELTALGAVIFSEQTRTYHGGLLLAHLGSCVTANFDLAKIARPHLIALQAETGHVATLSMMNGDRGIYCDKVEPAGFGLKLHSEIGCEFPLYCTAMGKAMLAFGKDSDRKAVSKVNMVSFTDRTITNSRDLRQELDQVHARGYAIDDEEITAGLTCIAAPILDHSGTILGAMSCTFATSVENAEGKKNIATIVQKYAAAIS